MDPETTEETVAEIKQPEVVVVPNLAGLAQLMNLARPYPIKRQRPFVDRRNSSSGYVTGRVHVCMGCGSLAVMVGTKWDRTLHRLFTGKPRTGRQYTLYTHNSCRAESYRKAQEFAQRQLQEAISARAEEAGLVA